MTTFNRLLSDGWGFLRTVLANGHTRCHAYLGRGTLMHGPDGLSVIMFTRSNDDMQKALHIWQKGCGRTKAELKPLRQEYVYPMALMHADDVKLEDEEL